MGAVFKAGSVAVIMLGLAGPGHTLPTDSAAGDMDFVRIDLDRRADDPVFVATRCRDFVLAVRTAAAIESSNPVTGRKPERDDALDWANAVDLRLSFPDARPQQDSDDVQNYLDRFDFATREQAYLSAPLYLHDKATCTPLFRGFNDGAADIAPDAGATQPDPVTDPPRTAE